MDPQNKHESIPTDQVPCDLVGRYEKKWSVFEPILKRIDKIPNHLAKTGLLVMIINTLAFVLFKEVGVPDGVYVMFFTLSMYLIHEMSRQQNST